jgi:hypothetical protein
LPAKDISRILFDFDSIIDDTILVKRGLKLIDNTKPKQSGKAFPPKRFRPFLSLAGTFQKGAMKNEDNKRTCNRLFEYKKCIMSFCPYPAHAGGKRIRKFIL